MSGNDVTTSADITELINHHTLVLNITSTLFIGLYNVIIILIGAVGNLCVLYTSLRHGAIEMDRVTLAFIENLALADILISVLYYLPMLVTLISKQWVFGGEMCWFTGFFSSHIPFLAEIGVIMAISCYRLWVLRKPPGIRKKIKVIHVKVLISTIWMACTIPVIYWIISGTYAFYDNKILSCSTSNHLPHSPTFMSTKILSIFFVAIPMIIVFLTNVKIMYTIILHTLKVGRSLQPHIKTVTTVSLICWAFLISYLPIFIKLLLNSSGIRIPYWFALFQVYAKSIHVVLNPFIYVATNTRFRRYVSNRMNRHTYTQPGDTPPDGLRDKDSDKPVQGLVANSETLV